MRINGSRRLPYIILAGMGIMLVASIAHYITCERPNHNQDALND